jgi:hypothetical protein
MQLRFHRISRWTLISLAVGAYELVIGIACLVVSRHTASKMQQLKERLTLKFDGDTLQEKFNRFDTDGNGHITEEEFRALCSE